MLSYITWLQKGYKMEKINARSVLTNMTLDRSWSKKDGPVFNRVQHLKLIAPITVKDLQHAIGDISDIKVPGYDGFNAFFFKDLGLFPLVGAVVTKVVLNFFEINVMFRPINCTTVTLIPKVSNPNKLIEFRPISSCSLLCKIISKILTKRMQKVIDIIVDKCQSAFVPDRVINDNIIIIHELIKGYSRKGISRRCMLKVNIKKAYHSVEWC